MLPGGRGDAGTARESEAWVALWQEKGFYEQPDLESSLKLPYLGGAFEPTRIAFEAALQEMDLRGGESILDLGAGQGWASRYFAERGCEAVAMDIIADEIYGLGRAWAIMEHAGVYFEPVLGDGKQLPFKAGSFDFVFFCGALHHFERFEIVLREVRRVLKPGGRLIAANEPAIPLAAREQSVQAGIEEVQKGIVERRPKVIGYWLPLVRAGFRDVRIGAVGLHRAAPEQTVAWLDGHEAHAFAAVRRPLRPVVRVGFALLRRLPHRLSRPLLLFLVGGLVQIQATAPRQLSARG
jgi:SAM-dependent methyltransferase